MAKVTPFLLMFSDQLEAAIEFYAATFPDSEIRNVARTGSDGPITSAEFVVVGQAARNYKPENRAFHKVALRVGISRRPPEPSRPPSHKLPSAESSANRTHSLAARRTPALT